MNLDQLDEVFDNQVQSKGFEDALKSLSSEQDINKALNEIGYFHVMGPRVSRTSFSRLFPLQTQRGVIRTNCLDCLDRTNVLQWYIGQRLLYGYLNEHQKSNIVKFRGLKYSKQPHTHTDTHITHTFAHVIA